MPQYYFESQLLRLVGASPRSIHFVLSETETYYDDLLKLEVCPGLRDHMFFFVASLSHLGFKFTSSREIAEKGLNVVFEGFPVQFATNLRAKLENSKSRMAIVMSEYFDYSGNNELTLNSTPWKRDSVGFAFFGYDELTPAMSRLVSLSYLLEFTSAFFLIGSEVNCAALRRFTPYITHVHFPFPNSQTVKKAGLSVVNKIVPEIRYDYTMSVPSRVSLTRYRVRVLRQIRKDKQIYMFSVRSMRQQFINSSLGEFALYIPKSKKFTFFSPMRLWMNALVNRYSVLEGIPKAHLLTSGFSELLLEPSDILNARSMSAIDLLDEISLNQTKQSIVCLNPY